MMDRGDRELRMPEHNSTRINGPLLGAVILLLAPIVYVVSYFVLVTPPGGYRWDLIHADRMFWPLEKVDRTMRPQLWTSWVFPKARIEGGFVPERAVIESSTIDNGPDQPETEP